MTALHLRISDIFFLNIHFKIEVIKKCSVEQDYNK